MIRSMTQRELVNAKSPSTIAVGILCWIRTQPKSVAAEIMNITCTVVFKVSNRTRRRSASVISRNTSIPMTRA